MIQGRRVEVPMFELAANPTIRLSDVKRGRRRLDSLCPVCKTVYQDLQAHVESMEDDLHAVLDVQES
jgi:hypothetical protein